IAMYKAKDEGKNSVKVYTSRMQTLLENNLLVQSDLRKAIEQSDLSIHLQPQYDQNGLIVSAEALVRWEHPDKGFIPPVEFIAIAEESGLIHALGRAVMIMVLETLQKLIKQKVPSSFKRIAINVSPWQLGQKDFVTEMEMLLEKYQIPASYLDIEITEQTLIGNFSVFAKKMEQMQKMGFYFSIDDFGTGYSSLSYLKSLPVNMLKIDRSFIEELTKNKNNDAIVDTIIVMARHMGLEVLAEGVETKVQLDFLKQHDCHFYQGYYFSKPLAIDNFIDLLSNQVDPNQ
ncbi:MAG: EAL domain-containing protein, partial [Thiotrichaceae bacterium]|nr:EAL domain-containing protein [Thiotrichaceae bacterium]